MKVLELTVELYGNKDVSINGRPSASGIGVFEEKLFSNMDPVQQWHILCELKKLMARAHFTYMKGRVLRGEITEGDAKRLLHQSSSNYKELSAADRALYDRLAKLGE
jgi:hypothetical protein